MLPLKVCPVLRQLALAVPIVLHLLSLEHTLSLRKEVFLELSVSVCLIAKRMMTNDLHKKIRNRYWEKWYHPQQFCFHVSCSYK